MNIPPYCGEYEGDWKIAYRMVEEYISILTLRFITEISEKASITALEKTFKVCQRVLKHLMIWYMKKKLK